MSDAIATIPNYCSYKAFKTGFSEGLGSCCNEGHLSCGETNPAKIRVRYYRIERVVDCTYLLSTDTSIRYMRGGQRVSKLCDWFDAYSVSQRYGARLKGGKCEGGSITSYEAVDKQQEIEDVLSETRQSTCLSCTDSGLSSSRNSTAKSWKRNIDKDCFRYSKEKGCIDWLETKCFNQSLKRTDSDRELIKSFEDHLLSLKPISRENSTLKLKHWDISEPGMYPACTHLKRKFGTDNSSCEDVRALNNLDSGETTLEEEVFEEELYYLGVPKVSYLYC